MKRKKLWAALLSLALCAALLAGCGGGAASGNNGNGAASDNGGASEGAQPSANAVQPSANAVTVSDMESFLEAVQPGAEIVVAKGDYNLSEYVNALWETDEAAEWNAAHEYVQIQDCYDGAEVVIRNADGLSVSGSGATAATEIVIEPRYGTVLTFQKCDNLKLSNLTLGHTDTGQCSGSVVKLSACLNAELRDLDLYGCGVVALECSDGTEDVFVYDSALRDCSWGPLDVYGATGKVELRGCYLTGSEGGGYFNSESRLQLAFYNCTFGENETYYWQFMPGVTAEDCVWTQDPDYVYDEDGEERYIPEDMPDDLQPVAFDADIEVDTMWLGYIAVDAETGEAVDIPSGDAEGVTLILRPDGTGVINGYYAERGIPFLWEKNDSGALTMTTPQDGVLEAEMYLPGTPGEGSPSWVSVRIGGALLWMY